jgi:uncharacterized protein YhaN
VERAEALGGVQAERAALAGERDAMESRFGSQDELEDRLAEEKRRLDELETRRVDTTELPDGFASPESFLASFREHERSLERLQTEYNDARVRQADLLARLPERTAEELRADLDDARERLERTRSRAAAIARLCDVAASVRDEQTADPFAPYTRCVAEYLAIASRSSYAVGTSDDPLRPGEFIRDGGGEGDHRPALEYELLSQGTKDMVALAIRLALARTATDSQAPAPLVMDDPLVDMDAPRREAAARAIEHYATGRQVIVMTCHEEHAKLFPGARVISLDDR